jgi:hypothetical protein
MVNHIHHWLSGKEKYGRHYCLAGTGFAGQPRVLSGSEYKSKTQDERRLRRYGPQRNNWDQVFLGVAGLGFRYCFFVFKYISFLPPLPPFRSKKHNPVIYFIFASYSSLLKEEITASFLFSFTVTVCHLFRLYNEMYCSAICNQAHSVFMNSLHITTKRGKKGIVTDKRGIWCINVEH